MLPETSINWKSFEYKHAANPQRAFENLTYCLFCHEFHQPYGIFRYFNQPHIETNPILIDNHYIGFQSKYYADSVLLSSKENELTEAVKGAARTYPGITTLYFYISREFSPSSKKDDVVPAYQKHVEATAKELGIELVWRVPSHIEAQLMQDKELTICRNVFFQVDSAVQSCYENLEKHKQDLFGHIHTSVRYQGTDITLANADLNLTAFLHSDNQVLLIDGNAGSGKSALAKQLATDFTDDSAFLVFKSTDLDVDDRLKFLAPYGELNLNELMNVYQNAQNRTLYIDAVEKYFVLENQQTFEDILALFIHSGWKLILTIRSAYKESFQNLLLHKINVQTYHLSPVSHDTLRELSTTYQFCLPQDQKLLDLLCAPFYLGLYLALDHLEDASMLFLTREAFEEKIWNDIIRDNRKRKNNLPVRRETALISLTMNMLQNESYFYTIQANDDHGALAELEKAGILIQSDDAQTYCHSHDVFEELVAGHIFAEQYRHGIQNQEFFAPFRASLRIRKLFREWLAAFAANPTHQELIFHLLDCEQVSQIWKDEILLTILSTDHLKEIYQTLTLHMTDNNYELLKKVSFLINTCCRAADHAEQYWKKGNLLPFRFSKPSGYAWQALFTFLLNEKDNIAWDKSLISATIELLDSWTKHIEHSKSEITKIAGTIGIFLFHKLSANRNLQYDMRTEQIQKLQDVLMNSAWMIQDPLKDIFQTVIDAANKAKQKQSNHRFPFPDEDAEPEAPKMYLKLAECAVSGPYHYGYVPFAMPEITLHLMEALWLQPASKYASYYHQPYMEEYFGLSHHMDFMYENASAYQTPVFSLLQTNYILTTDFLVDLFNQASTFYVNSFLNQEYKECFQITLYVNNTPVRQTASDRLWHLYRGTSVGPNLLISLLMGFEKWLLHIAPNTKPDILIAYFQDLLMRSNNVMLTSVIVSIAEAYPDKLFPLICDLLRTKELFHLDSHRATKEYAAFISPFAPPLFREERLESNQLPHRKERLESVILSYQSHSPELSEADFQARKQTLYHAIDLATADIDTWLPNDKFAYYRMDLRHYQTITDIQKQEDGLAICTVRPDFSDDMLALSQKTQITSENSLRYTDLQIWSDYKFHNDPKFQEYKKYEDVTAIWPEFDEICQYLNGMITYDGLTPDDQFLLLHRFTSIAAYTSAVLLRDFKEKLSNEQINLCEDVILSLGSFFKQLSPLEAAQAGNGMEAIAAGLILLVHEENSQSADDTNPLYLLLRLALKDWGYNSCVMEQIALTLWKHSIKDARRFLSLFLLLAEPYEAMLFKSSDSTDDAFFAQNKDLIIRALANNTVDLNHFDFTTLDSITLLTLFSLVSAQTEDAFQLASATKDLMMPLVFAETRELRTERRNISGYTLRYVVWLADVLLHCNKDQQKILLDSFFKFADLRRNHNVEYFLTYLIQEQEIYGKTNTFWEIWEFMKPYMIGLSNQTFHSHAGEPVPYGCDKLIITYLFANSSWKPNVHRCALLPEERAVFFQDFIDKSENTKAILHALAKLLNTVGMEPYKESGIDWIYKLVLKDPECRLTLYDNTLYYLEEYIGHYVARHRLDFRTNVTLSLKTQTVLEYMVNQGSPIAFFLREQI